jgi:hypothetical protein
MSETPASRFAENPLSASQARILGSLIEKQLTTPESYPLTLNSLVLACNQKTSREPLMNLTPGEVGQGLRELESRNLVRLTMGSRADRWEQRCDKALELVAPQVALLGLLLLRGPQTAGELFARSLRLHPFDDAEQLQHHLDRLIARGLVIRLPRQSGQREERFAQLLCGLDVQLQAAAAQTDGAAAEPRDADRLAALEARVAALEARLAQLETRD